MNNGFVPKPGRPTRAQAAAISKAILEAATASFLEEGFDDASIDAIAARANVPRSTLYKRYSDKRDLLRAVIRARVAEWSSQASKGDAGLPQDCVERLKLRAAGMLMMAVRPEVRAISKLAASAWRTDAEARERLEVGGFMTMVELVETDIRELGPAQGLLARSPRSIAEALMAMLFGWLEMNPGSDETEACAFARLAVDLLLRGAAAW